MKEIDSTRYCMKAVRFPFDTLQNRLNDQRNIWIKNCTTVRDEVGDEIYE